MSKRDDFHAIRRRAARALRRGDIDTAARWILAMHYLVRMSRSLADLDGNRPRPRPKPFKPAPAPPPPPRMPVMLDPDGFSPGGEPNWVLNQRRLERAGLTGKVIPPSPSRTRRAR